MSVNRLIELDPWLNPYRDDLMRRLERHERVKTQISRSFGSVMAFARGDKYFGFNRGENEGKKGVWYREWAPGALSLSLVGDFNDWCRFRHPMSRDEFGVWRVFVDDEEAGKRLVHGSKVKVFVAGKKHQVDKISAYAKRVVPEGGGHVGVFWDPPRKYKFKNKRPKRPVSLRIYEAHVGMAQEKDGIGSFSEFGEKILPRIKKAGYNAIQLMAIAQHPYYGSFGYQVSHFFAVSHFFGEEEELKMLIDEAHELGIIVLMDLVHSHTVRNVEDGLNEFDGTKHQYFHEGERGYHPDWDTRLFDYGQTEVLRYLLSNVRYWMEEFYFDGFRFDGVTSMMYWDRGRLHAFDHYDRYFKEESIDADALVYLQMANELIHEINPEAVTIAEDVSGMPGIARPVGEGGLGFDFRLAMGIPDFWIKYLRDKRDDEWSMKELYANLRNRRYGEDHIGYAESHDQALVGDKTIAFWLMDSEMYWNMAIDRESLVIDRGVALHKMIRLVTMSLGGEGWLNFMGNEFGHPEWVDFPREGNNFSYWYARRQWSLVDNERLRYRQLAEFDRAMCELEEKRNWLAQKEIEPLILNDSKKLLAYRRGELVVVGNFDPSRSDEGLAVAVPGGRRARVVLSSDEEKYGGFGRVKEGQSYPVKKLSALGGKAGVMIYLPCRTLQVLAMED